MKILVFLLVAWPAFAQMPNNPIANSDGATFRGAVNANFSWLNTNKAGNSACASNQYAIQTTTAGVVCASLTNLQITTALGFTPAANNASTTVNGQTCALGSTCSVTDSSKIPLTAIDTDSTMAANSDSVVPSQKAVKSALGGKAASNASTTVNSQSCALGGSCTIPVGVRNLNGPGVAAKCQAGVAAAAFSLPSANAPAAACESDGFQAYLAYTANTAQTAYDRFDLPADWTGAIKVVVTAYSTSTNAPTIAVSLSCISTGATASPTFGTAQTISLTPGATSGRTSVSTTLQTTNTYANKACAAGDLVEWKLAITAAAAADLRVLSVRFTE